MATNIQCRKCLPLYKDTVQLFAQSGTGYTPTLLVSFGGPFAVGHLIHNEIGLEDKKKHRFKPFNLISQRIARSNQVDSEQHIFQQVSKGANSTMAAT